jgi:phasin family protein
MENHVSAAKALMTARSMQELIERQTEYARSSFDSYVAELNQLSDVMVGVAREALQPFSERVNALGQMVQVNGQPRSR